MTRITFGEVLYIVQHITRITLLPYYPPSPNTQTASSHETPMFVFKPTYTLSREYPWKRFDQFAGLGTLIGILILGVVTFATQGYETESTLSSSFNLTQSLWYNHFTPAAEPGTLCDPYVFTVGDTFQTMMSPFIWTIDFINTIKPAVKLGHANSNGLSYSGSALNTAGCDVSSLRVSADLSSWTATATAVIQCNENGIFPVSASTSFTSSINKQKATAASNKFEFRAGSDDPSLHLCNNMYASLALLQSAGIDLLTALRLEMNPSSQNQLLSLSASSDITSPCNGSGDDPSAHLELDVILEMLGFSNLTLTANDAALQIFNTSLYNTTYNFMQVMLASVRVDLGNQCPTNMLMTQPSIVNNTLRQTPELINATYLEFYPQRLVTARSLYDIINSDNTFLTDTFDFKLPLNGSSQIFLQAPFLCHMTVLKSPTQVIVSVIVAMASLFMSGWGLFSAIASWFAIRHSPEANFCDGHWRYLRSNAESVSTPVSEKEYSEKAGKDASALTPDIDPALTSIFVQPLYHIDSMDSTATVVDTGIPTSGQT
ncbi:hypothetical protein FRB94_003429 [Tulasnella sp. JGI-2019a]|nr:hypothetical protein FRB93_005293 [Tulasnella sp. JGI-2019a]KAG9002958.1 hypothetical protein FRB94_003429 [Tulasnella sp. JGI-2019a]